MNTLPRGAGPSGAADWLRRTAVSRKVCRSCRYEGARSLRITRSTASRFIRQYSCARRSCRMMPRSSGSSIRTSTIGTSPEMPCAHSAAGPPD